jgi:type II secretory ATPase GspE/PulE/Tfp pilus assembly ATPase PilB-like protein
VPNAWSLSSTLLRCCINLTPDIDDFTVIRLWQAIVTQAIQARASDIHIEALEHKTVIRIRVDGVLQTLQFPIAVEHERIIARIKILARLDIAEQRIPQDGRLSVGLNYTRPDIDCRVSILPTLHGEKAVLRLLPPPSTALDLDLLGLHALQLAHFRDAIAQPDGLILVTGPTGSGKTRTLYSCLNQLNTSGRNICTIEDPIEIRLAGVNQIAYHPKAGLDFNGIIRALLRQDPDVIMIGEIRDAVTAELAMQAAQTGHLVLSTLHTRGALASVQRLRSLGIASDVLQACLRCVSSQRLARQICCACHAEGSRDDCLLCGGTGLFDRLGIHEVLPFTNTIANAFENNLTAADLSYHVQKNGFQDMRSAGMVHVANQRITLAELNTQLGSWH